MSQFFTTLEKNGSKFIGVIHDANTHQVLHRTNEQDTQEQALNDVNHFVSANKVITTSESITTAPSTPIVHNPPPRKCCGR
jgi:hypothetical protein